MNYVVRLKDITVAFGNNVVLDGVSLDFEEGIIHGLVGPGGGGKSLMLKIISTVFRPDKGGIEVFGKDVYKIEEKGLVQIRSKIGFQFQNIALFDFLNVEENVAFPITKGREEELTDEVRKKVAKALEAVGLGGTQHLDIKELSGGMQRRVAMARAMIFNPDLLLLDDPSAGLDPVTSSKIFELIRQHYEKSHCTVIVATQDVDRLVKFADRLHILYNHKVHFSGTKEEAWALDDQIVKHFFPKEVVQ